MSKVAPLEAAAGADPETGAPALAELRGRAASTLWPTLVRSFTATASSLKSSTLVSTLSRTVSRAVTSVMDQHKGRSLRVRPPIAAAAAARVAPPHGAAARVPAQTPAASFVQASLRAAPAAGRLHAGCRLCGAFLRARR
jgi:hypothetical protein